MEVWGNYGVGKLFFDGLGYLGLKFMHGIYLIGDFKRIISL
jgi:hypothetical protein